MTISEKEIDGAFKTIFTQRECGECGYRTKSKNPEDEIAEHWLIEHRDIIKKLILNQMNMDMFSTILSYHK